MKISLQEILIICTSTLNTLIGLFVLLKRPKRIINISFFITLIGISVWGLGLVFLGTTHNFAVYDKFTIYGFLIFLFGFVIFSRVFPNQEKIDNKFYKILNKQVASTRLNIL